MNEDRVTTDDGVRLWVASTGSGPPLLLCHGGPGAFDTLEPLGQLIDDIVTVHHWDQRGAGRSDHTGPYTVARFVADIESLRGHFGYRRWIVAGHSWGANLALLYAQHHPHRVDAVVYIAGTGLGWWPLHRRRYGQEKKRRLGPERARRLAELASRDRDVEEERERRYFNTVVEFSDPAMAGHLAERVVEAHERYAINLEANTALNTELKSRKLIDEVQRCARLRAPVLIVDCAGDVRPVEATDSLAAALSNVRRVQLPTGHYPWIERPDAFRAVLRDFLLAEPVPSSDARKPS